MSSATATCSNGHLNSVTQKFCGECGVALAGVCPNGHPNPRGQHFCGECGNPIEGDPGGVHPGERKRRNPVGQLADRVKAWWARLPKWRKVAVTGVPVALIAIFGGGGRDQGSYDFGYQKGRMGFTQEFAGGTSDEKACDGILKGPLELPSSKNIVKSDAMQGCMDALNGHPQGSG